MTERETQIDPRADKQMQPQRPMAFWLRGLLFLSLALNLAVAGMVAGAVLRDKERPGPRAHRLPPPATMIVGSTALREARPADRRNLREQARGEHKSVVARRAHETAALLALLRDTPFDRAALEAELARQDTAQQADLARMQRLWVGIVTEMTAAERAAFADQVEARLERARRGGKGERPPKP